MEVRLLSDSGKDKEIATPASRDRNDSNMIRFCLITNQTLLSGRVIARSIATKQSHGKDPKSNKSKLYE
jgi:hypothetical protein